MFLHQFCKALCNTTRYDLNMRQVHFIFYVQNQNCSTEFYSNVLSTTPILNVPGMTQFQLPGSSILGLMPESGIKRLIGEPLPDPSTASGIPRTELYLVVSCANSYLQRALSGGASLLSTVQLRDWGQSVGYCLDPDGHVLAFADESDAA